MIMVIIVQIFSYGSFCYFHPYIRDKVSISHLSKSEYTQTEPWNDYVAPGISRFPWCRIARTMVAILPIDACSREITEATWKFVIACYSSFLLGEIMNCDFSFNQINRAALHLQWACVFNNWGLIIPYILFIKKEKDSKNSSYSSSEIISFWWRCSIQMAAASNAETFP